MERSYLVTFGFGSKHSLQYVVMKGKNKDDVYGRACMVYGFLDVAGVHLNTPDNLRNLQQRNFKELKR